MTGLALIRIDTIGNVVGVVVISAVVIAVVHALLFDQEFQEIVFGWLAIIIGAAAICLAIWSLFHFGIIET